MDNDPADSMFGQRSSCGALPFFYNFSRNDLQVLLYPCCLRFLPFINPGLREVLWEDWEAKIQNGSKVKEESNHSPLKSSCIMGGSKDPWYQTT